MSQVSSVRDRAGTQHDNTGSPVAVNLPATVTAGDRLVVVFVVEGTRTVSASGWTVLVNDGTPTMAVLWKEADGTEGGGTVSVAYDGGTNADSLAYAYAIISAGTPEATIATGSSLTPDPPSLSPAGGDAEYQWLAAFGEGGGVNTLEWPDDFGGWAGGISVGNGLTMGVAERPFQAATLDPTAFTSSSNVAWVAATVAVPAAADPGNFPVAETVAESTWASSAASQTLTMPAGVVAGDLLIAEIGTTGNSTPAITGWTTLVGPEFASTFETGAVLFKESDGTEGASETVTFDISIVGSGSCRRISGADAAKLEGDINNASAATVTPPPLTPAAGSDEILWIVGHTGDTNVSYYRTSGGTPVPWPFNYSLLPVWIRVDSGLYTGAYAFEGASVTPALYTISASRRTVSWTLAVYPTAAVPDAPTNPAATALSDSSIRITWDDVADETGYRVERSDDGVGGWADVSGDLAADTVLFDDTGLTASTQFFYRVFAFNGSGDSAPSSTVNATTDAATGGGNRMGGTGAIRKPPRRN